MCLSFKKIDLNAEINGRCPLHYAADYGQADVLGYLIGKGANVNVSNRKETFLQKSDSLSILLLIWFRYSSSLWISMALQQYWLLFGKDTQNAWKSYCKMLVSPSLDVTPIQMALIILVLVSLCLTETYIFQGATKDGSAPDGTPYIDAAEKPEIKELLK